MLQAGRPRVRNPMRRMKFPNLHHPAAIGLEVYSASNRNEYQKQKDNVSGE
jgi:hypothetical protein